VWVLLCGELFGNGAIKYFFLTKERERNMNAYGKKHQIQNAETEVWAHSKRNRIEKWYLRLKDFLFRKLPSETFGRRSREVSQRFRLHKERDSLMFQRRFQKYLRTQAGIKTQNPLILANQRVSPPERVGRKRSHTQLPILADARGASTKSGLFLSYLSIINNLRRN
jgi:hypothetical protein